jgi:tetratricopeptide (TPR) repeat protein
VETKMYLDVRGLEVHAADPESVEQLDGAIEAYLGADRSAPERAKMLLLRDPDCPLAHVLQGYFEMHAARPEMVARARGSLALVDRIAFPLNRRETMHKSALRAWIDGDLQMAVECWEAILAQHPRDLLAVRLAQFMTSYLGRSRDILASVERVFGCWDPQIPGYGYLLGCLAYGLEEAGEYSLAEQMGRDAINLNPSDLWAAHAVTHVMEMQLRPREGLAWMTSLEPGWQQCNNFVRHLKWHRALYLLTLREFDYVLQVYDREVRPGWSDEYLDFANAASLLWRLEQENVSVGSRWEELADCVLTHREDHLFVFADLHYMLAASAAGPSTGNSFLASCAAFAESGGGTQSAVMKQIGLDIAAAILAHREGAYAEALRSLFPTRAQIHLIGGSHAQRDTFERLLIDSAVRSGDTEKARLLLMERTAARRDDLWAWRTWKQFAESALCREDAAYAANEIERLSGSLKARSS